jgi:uracil-DNA glycosylase
MNDSLFLKEQEIHSGWQSFLSDEIINLIASIETRVAQAEYTPAADKVLRFFKVPLPSVKIIILGQDPYPQKGVATGRAFEVGTLKSWRQTFQNVSLKNILRLLYKTYTGNVISFSNLKEELYSNFPILPPDKLFEHWENQGVLLLNTSFTCKPGHPGSHQKEWKEFTGHLLKFIATERPDVTWFIWGNHAVQATRNLQLKRCVTTMHPMMCYDLPERKNDFLFGNQNGFKAFIREIDWTGYAFGDRRNIRRTLF